MKHSLDFPAHRDDSQAGPRYFKGTFMKATWIIMRHFAKKPHPQTFTKEDIIEAAASPTLAEMLVEKWEMIDREEVSISNEGIRQGYEVSMQLPEYLRRMGASVDRIIASPYQRTYESAQLLRRSCFSSIKVQLDERLTELKLGIRCIAPDFTDACIHWPEYDKAAHQAFLEAAPPFGESHAEARDGRVRSFLEDLKRKQGGTLIVTHAGVIECLHQLVYGTPDDEVVRKFAEERSARFGSILVCTYDRASDRITPVIDDQCLYDELS